MHTRITNQSKGNASSTRGVLQPKYNICPKKTILQRIATDKAPDTVPPIVQGVLRSSGQPLDPITRASIDPRFGHDFSRVRVHSGPLAIAATTAVNAHAFTVGQDIVLGERAYMPTTKPSPYLLSHELTHIAQQKWDGGPTIGPSNDEYEREADRIANQVMSVPELNARRACTPCEEKAVQTTPPVARIAPLVERSSRIARHSTAPAIVHEVLRSPGHPLDHEIRAFMEQRFGHDFSGVRVHHDGQSNQISNALNAQAFTRGRDIYFGAGNYAPDTSEGRKLMAHELTHVIQQRQANTNPTSSVIIQRLVSRSCREVETGKTVLDTLAGLFNLKHCWLRTATKEAGMGPADDGPLPAFPIGIKAKITDHSKDIPTESTVITGIDENCVNQKLQIGKSTGRWSPWNNCNTFVDKIIDICREKK